MLSARPWRTDAVVIFIVAQVACFLAGESVITILSKIGLPGFKDIYSPGNVLLATLSLQGATWVLMGIFFRQHNVRWSEALGFNRGNLPFALSLAFLTTIVIFFVAAWLNIISMHIMEKIHWLPKEEAAVSLLTRPYSLPMKIYLVFFTVAIAPVGEEFIFRGVLFPFLKQRGYRKTAWLGLSLIFALIHGDLAILVPLFVLALAFTWLYETTDNFLAPVFAHSLFNTMNLVMLFKFPPH